MRRGVEARTRQLRGEMTDSAHSMVRLPTAVEALLDQLTGGELEIRGLDLQTSLVAVGRVVAYALITAAWVVGSAILTDTNTFFGAVGFGIATLMTLLFLRSLLKARRAERG
jgi:hypothetical protein